MSERGFADWWNGAKWKTFCPKLFKRGSFSKMSVRTARAFLKLSHSLILTSREMNQTAGSLSQKGSREISTLLRGKEDQ